MNHDRYCWKDSYGRVFRTPQEIEDTHLANLIDYHKKYRPSNVEQLEMFVREAKRRGLSEDFLKRAEIPHKNPNGDQWMLWDKEANRPMPVSNLNK